ncbi:MAG: AAA family ATPase [Treponema sp.]|nr:AAA family ATPase [Spirochaetia bacterium]MDD7451105.1 AAA family ATPase [Treponema sp.]MDY2925330.1 AAA family ATPase [Treponema sp.]
MQIESIKIHNYKVLKDVEVKDISNMAVFLGKNGVGKTTFFDVFGFLHDCLIGNVKTALARRGGFNEVISRNQEGTIDFEIKFRAKETEPLITYQLSIGLDERKFPVVSSEILKFRRGSKGQPWKVLDFKNGEGIAIEGVLNTNEDVTNAIRKSQKLDSPDILAIKGLGQFKEFEAVATFRRLIEDWYVADFKVDAARERNESVYGEDLTRTGDNLSIVTKYIYDNYPENFQKIIKSMKERIPGVDDIQAKETDDGYIVLKFQNGEFKNPFSAKFVSDGTIKMFTYLVLLNSPMKHALLCIEEPENQLYPELLEELAEEFRLYALNGGQVFVSTHSPDFLNAIDANEVFYFEKKNGFTQIKKATENELFMNCIEQGDLPGSLWKQGILTGE